MIASAGLKNEKGVFTMQKYWLAVLLILALLLSACGGGAKGAPADTEGNLALAPAEEDAESSYSESIPDEPYAAVEYSLYPAARYPEFILDAAQSVGHVQKSRVELSTLFVQTHN